MEEDRELARALALSLEGLMATSSPYREEVRGRDIGSEMSSRSDISTDHYLNLNIN